MTYDDDTDADEPEDILEQAKEIFDLCIQAEKDNRLEFRDDLHFGRLGEQWPAAVRQQRERDGRPCLTNNLLPAFIRQVVNDARQNKPSISVHPADDTADPETAEIISGLIRNIEVSSNAEVAYDTALDFAVSGGWGYIRVNTAYTSDDTFEQDIVIEAVADPMQIYGDPHSTSADSSDWNHAFVVEMMPRKEFARTYKGKEKIDWENGPYSDISDPWRDGDQIALVQYWCRKEVPREIVALSDGDVVDAGEYEANKQFFDDAQITVVGRREVTSHKVTQYLMTGAEVLKTIEWKGRYIPIIPVYGEDITVDGKRHLRSLIRDAKDAVRQRNYHLSTATEVIALAPKAPFIGPVGAFETDALKWQTANSESWAYIEYDGPQAPQRQGFAGVPAGEMQQLLMASDDMKAIMGLHDASLGARSNETSGRAIMARQREGDVSNFHFVDNLSRAIRHTGRVIIDLIPQVYSVPRVIRVMGPDGTPENKVVNQEHPAEPGDESEGHEIGEALKIYDLRVGKYDLVVKTGPSFTSRREEAATQMVELIRAFPQAAPVIGDLLAKNLDWPGADEVAERLHALLPPQIQEQLKGGKGATPRPRPRRCSRRSRPSRLVPSKSSNTARLSNR